MAPSMAVVRRTRGRRETGVLEDRSGVVLEGSRCRESERRAPGGLIIGEAELCPGSEILARFNAAHR